VLEKGMSSSRQTRAPRGARKPAGSYHHGNLRTALVECGMRLLEKEGAGELSLRRTAALAGVSPAAPAHHFGDKTGLLAAIAAEGFRRLMAQARTAIEASPSGASVDVLVLNYVRFARDNRALFQVMFGPDFPEKSRHPELGEIADKSFRGLDGAVRRHMEGEARRHRVDDTLAVWSLMHGLAALVAERQRAPVGAEAPAIESVVPDATAALLAGLVARAPRRRRSASA
jgi:AcrR family transcriptional regulator